MLTFLLKGAQGEEIVNILDEKGKFLETIALTSKWKRYRYNIPRRQAIIIEYINDNSAGTSDKRNVQFKAEMTFTIALNKKWPEWNCNSANENYRCNRVRSGHFNWNGKYTITPGSPPIVL